MTAPDDTPAPQQGREPIFLVPGVIAALLGVMWAVHAASTWLLDIGGTIWLWEWFGFVPFRLTDPQGIPGGALPMLWTLFTHAFLHADWMHLIFNSAWLAIFGTPVARRYGTGRVLAVFLLGAAAGALVMLASLLAGSAQFTVLIGASGGVSALTGAAMRFVFQPVVVVHDPQTGTPIAAGRRTATLAQVWANGSSRAFVLIWLGLNLVIPFAPLVTGGEPLPIAWQAHIGGFIAGLLLPSLFDASLARRRAA